MDYDAERCAWRLHQFEGKEAGVYTDPLLAYTSPRYVEGQMTLFTYPAPTMVRDIHKKVLLWSLPGILLPARQVSRVVLISALISPVSKRKMQAATAGITRQFEQYAPQPSSRTWQRRPEQFVPTESGIPPLGTPAFSPGCFEGGTAVSQSGCSPPHVHTLTTIYSHIIRTIQSSQRPCPAKTTPREDNSCSTCSRPKLS